MNILLKRVSLVLFAFLSACNFGHADDHVGLSPFEKAELKRLLELDFRDLGKVPIRSVLGYEQEHWRNPASVHVIRPNDISLNGHVLMVDSFRNVAGMYVSRGVGYDDFVTMRNFSGTATEKFLTMVDGREVLQIMGGTINWTKEDVPLAILDRVEIIRGPGASIWGTNSVSGVVNVVTKHAASTQGNSVRLLIEHDGTFLGEYVHGGQISEDSHYRVWLRAQEYSEGELISGMPARDDGFARKAGFRYDKILGPDLDFTFAGGFATRRVEHVMDLSYRLFDGTTSLPLNATGFNKVAAWAPTWAPYATGTTLPINTGSHAGFGLQLDRYQNYEDMPQDGSHIRAKLSGVTDNDFEWSLSTYAELYDTTLGHVGHSWEHTEYDLDFRANSPLGEYNHIAFGFSYRYLTFDVDESVTAPWNFPVFESLADAIVNNPLTTFTPPILQYGDSPTSFERISGFFQDSVDINDNLVLSLGAKFEDSDLTGSSYQPGARLSFTLDQNNIFWGAYAKAYRQPSLVEKYTDVSYGRVFLGPSQAYHLVSPGNSSLGTEEMESYEIGWRIRPSTDLLIELSLYQYDTKNAVFSGPPVYIPNAVETIGGEFTFDYKLSDSWNLKGGFSHSKGKIDNEVQDDFPESMASLTSHLKIRDNLIFSKNIYYVDDRIIPSVYNEIPIDAHLRLDLGLIWQLKDDWEIGLFGRDLLDPDHAETMYNELDVEPGKVERTFLLSITKDF